MEWTKDKDDCLKPKIETIINFLAHLFDKGASYNKILTAKSALSNFLCLDIENNLGSLPVIKRFLKGVFQVRPSLTYQSRIAKWDPSLVINLISQWYPHNEIGLKYMTLKLCFLLCVVSGQRCQTLACINVKDILFQEGKCTIFIRELLKTSRRGVQQLPIELLSFPHETICPVTALKSYLEITETIRKSEKLFISWQKPHANVSAGSIARWVKNLLKIAGIESTAHSTRSMSTSIAAAQGLPIQEILKAAGWSSESTFTKFYKIPTTENFGKIVLSISKNRYCFHLNEIYVLFYIFI